MAGTSGTHRGYELVIRAKFDGKNETWLHLDTITEKNLTSSARIPTQPMQDGNTMADHMYRNPDEYSVSGTFSLYGKYWNDKTYDKIDAIGNTGDRLTNIQAAFEYIKNNGILCDLTTMTNDNMGDIRFKQRNHMALESITWRESQASMAYSLTFKEIICVDVEEDTVKTDENLPSIYMPSAKSLGEIMVSDAPSGEMSVYAKILTRLLIKKKLLIVIEDGDESVLDTLSGGIFGKSYIEERKNTIIKLISVINSCKNNEPIFNMNDAYNSIVYKFLSYCLDKIKPGKEAVSVGIHTTFVYHNITIYTNFENYLNSKGNIIASKALADPEFKLNFKELNRLENLLTDVKNRISELFSKCMMYSISSGKNDNDEREVVLNIENTTYYVLFTKDQTSDIGWKISVTSQGNYEAISLGGDNGEAVNVNCWPICVSFDDLTKDNCIFIDSTY